MKFCNLLGGVSLGALALAVAAPSVCAQEALPTIEVGAAQPSNGGGAGQGAGLAGSNSGTGSSACADGVCNSPTSYAAPVETLGTKTNALVMDTPLAVKTVTHQMLEDQQVISLDQALRDVSGVSITGGGQIGIGNNFSAITIRGFTTGAIYRDGVRIDNFGANTTGVGNVEFANVDSVEVLKGPAAILYGAVEPGGIVNLNMKQPQDKPAYSIEQQIGSYASYRTTLDATGPLSANKDLLYRFTMSYENDGSFQTYGYARNLMFNPVIKWNIDANTWVKFEAQYQENRLSQIYADIPMYNGVVPLWLGRGMNWGPPSPLSQPSLYSQLSWHHDFDNDWSIKQTIFMQRVSLSAASNLPLFIDDQITGGYGSNTLLNEYSQPINNRQEEYATVVDVTGHFKTGELKHTLLIGADYYRYNQRGALIFPNQFGTLSLFGPPQLPTTAGQFYPGFAGAQQANNIGAYVQDQIDLPFGFHVLGGARYQYIGSGFQATDGNNVCGPYAGPNGTGYGIPCTFNTLTEQSFAVNQRVTPRAGLLWRPYEWVSLYGNYVESYSPNYNGYLNIATNAPVPPSAGQQTEGGVKFELLDKKLQITAAYYHLIKTNIPVSIPGDYVHQQVIGEGRAQGPELDIQGEILPGWNVNLTYANTDAITTKSAAQQTPVGSPFAYVPRNQGSLASSYEFKDGSFKGLKLGARYDYTGYLPFYHYDNNANYIYGQSTPSYGLVGLFAGYEFNYNNLKIHTQINVDNLFDKTYFVNGGFGWLPGFIPGFGAPAITPGWGLNINDVIGAPRTIRGSIKVAF